MKFTHVIIGVLVLVIIGMLITRNASEVALAPSDTTPPDTAVPTQDNQDVPEVNNTTPIPPRSGVTLDMSNQGLREVPQTTFKKTATEILDLHGNALVSVPAEIRQFSNLRELDLSDNMLTNIPAELGQLSKLEVLNLRNNKLTGLPYELGNLKNLQTLDLRGNAYATADLEIITQSLSPETVVLTDD